MSTFIKRTLLTLIGAVLSSAAPAATGQWQEAAAPEALPGDLAWPAFNGREDGNRFSELKDINIDNVGDLTEVCRVRVSGPGAFSTGPVVVDGVMYLTAQNSTMAISPVNCDIKWKSIYIPTAREQLPGNRGVAVSEGIVARGTGDGHIVAYDAASGRQLWIATAGDSGVGEFVTSAPLAWHGLLFVGLSGGDWGIQGRMMAFDLKTGERKWSFNTIPGPGEFGNETWAGDSWRHGGGGIWTSVTLDTATGELFVPVANPAPDFNGTVRKGTNLFSSSILVLDAMTGRYRWHFQTEPHDAKDRGVTSAPILYTAADGTPVAAVATKAGYLYAVSRKTHRLLFKVPTTTIFNEKAEPTSAGIRVCPGIFGGSEWNSPGLNPQLNSLVVGTVDWCGTISTAAPKYQAGELYFGGSAKQEEQSSGWITSFNASSGAEQWQFHAPAPVVSGVTPTAGGITFVGDLAGTLYAFRSTDGKILKSIATGGAIAGGIVTYKALGRQYLAVTSGNISRATWPKATGIPSIVIFSVENSAAADSSVESGGSASQQIARAEHIYSTTCASCHGGSQEGAVGPPLRKLAEKYDRKSLEAFIKDPRSPMPKLYPAVISERDVADLSLFLMNK